MLKNGFLTCFFKKLPAAQKIWPKQGLFTALPKILLKSLPSKSFHFLRHPSLFRCHDANFLINSRRQSTLLGRVAKVLFYVAGLKSFIISLQTSLFFCHSPKILSPAAKVISYVALPKDILQSRQQCFLISPRRNFI